MAAVRAATYFLPCSNCPLFIENDWNADFLYSSSSLGINLIVCLVNRSVDRTIAYIPFRLFSGHCGAGKAQENHRWNNNGQQTLFRHRHTPPFFCSHQEPLYNQRNSHSLRFNFQEKIFQIFHLCKFRQKESQTFVNSHKCPAFLSDAFCNFHNLIVWNVSHNGMCNPPMFPT